MCAWKSYILKGIQRFFYLCIINFCFIPCSYATHAISDNLPSILEKVMPSVVNVSAQGEILAFPTVQDLINQEQNPNLPPGLLQPVPMPFANLGSGVIVDDKKGYILTNAHLIKDAKHITITLSDGRKFNAKLLGVDPPSDIAVLQIPANNLHAISFANSDLIKVGQPVAAIGNPFGLNQTATSGIISALHRTLYIENYENFIQTDAPINPGNSGGALVDMQGNLIGINTAIYATSGGNLGIGFAVPINMAHSIMTQLIKYGAVHRGLLGVIVNDLTPDLADAFQASGRHGAVVAMVTPNSPAQKAGIQAGDIILSINEHKIKDGADVKNTVGLLRVGAQIRIRLLHQGKEKSVSIITADPNRYQNENEANNPFLFGTDLRNFDEITTGAGRIQGVLLLRVNRNSLAWQAGLRAGDVIMSVNQIPIHNIDQLLVTIKKDPHKMLLNIYRAGAALFILVR